MTGYRACRRKKRPLVFEPTHDLDDSLSVTYEIPRPVIDALRNVDIMTKIYGEDWRR